MPDVEFASPEVASFWRFIASSLDRLVELAGALEAEGLHWSPPARDANSVAVLVTHTLGNAEENVLETLAGEAVGRRREEEFVDRRLTAGELLQRWQELRPRLAAALARLPAAEMDRPRAHPRRGRLTGREVLIVVARHAAEHLGQAELTRDLWLSAGTWRAGS